MIDDETLDQDKMVFYASKLTKDISKLITSQRPACMEVLAGGTAACANVLVIMVTKMVGKEKAPDIVARALSTAFRGINEAIAEQEENEKHTNTKTPGS
jgi:hypothetical protein